jgi:hypothetical protein
MMRIERLLGSCRGRLSRTLLDSGSDTSGQYGKDEETDDARRNRTRSRMQWGETESESMTETGMEYHGQEFCNWRRFVLWVYALPSHSLSFLCPT